MSSESTTMVKHGNVLILLNTLYTSGFATTSPTIPMLTSKTMHTLYASSFLIYSINCFFNWIHTYCILKGYLTSFPLKIWFVISVVIVAVSGSMLCILLVMLCIENAFAYRLNVTPYKSGFAVIWEAFLEWVHSFNNFRVAFLFMLLHDVPITFSNFFLISSCRFAGPQVLHWPLLISSLSTIMSLGWRLVMLYFAYRRLIFPPRKRNVSIASSQRGWLGKNSSFRGGRYGAPPVILLNDSDRLDEYDELWPIRWASLKVYGKYKNEKKVVYLHDSFSMTLFTFKHFIIEIISFITFKIYNGVTALLKRIAFFAMVIIVYFGYTLTCCLPCLHHYFCRKNSFTYRHNCSKAFVRRCTFVFHYTTLALSVICVLIFILFNIVLIFSVQIYGSNNVPPEINTICFSINTKQHIIRPFLNSTSSFELFSGLLKRVTNSFLFSYKSQNCKSPSLCNDDNTNVVHDEYKILCKPIWEYSGFGVDRKEAGTWQTRISLDEGQLLAISIRLASTSIKDEMTSQERLKYIFLYDFALISSQNTSLNKPGFKELTQCLKRSQTDWYFINSFQTLNFPYFFACYSSMRMRRSDLIDCRAFMHTTYLHN